MNPQDRQRLIDDLQTSREQVSALLRSVVDAQDWQPDPKNWSFRYIAAHMAACEKECLQVRVMQIVADENPHFTSYLNTDRDFSHLDLRDSLDQWAATRCEILALFRALPDEKLTLTGRHDSFGLITVPDHLRIMLDHDHEHLHHLEQILAQYQQQQQSASKP